MSARFKLANAAKMLPLVLKLDPTATLGAVKNRWHDVIDPDLLEPLEGFYNIENGWVEFFTVLSNKKLNKIFKEVCPKKWEENKAEAPPEIFEG